MNKLLTISLISLVSFQAQAYSYDGLKIGLTKYSADITNAYINGNNQTVNDTASYYYIPYSALSISEDGKSEHSTFALNALVSFFFKDDFFGERKGYNSTTNGGSTLLSSELSSKNDFYFVDSTLWRSSFSSKISNDLPYQFGFQGEIANRGIFDSNGQNTLTLNSTETNRFVNNPIFSGGVNFGYIKDMGEGLLDLSIAVDFDFGATTNGAQNYELYSAGTTFLYEANYYLDDFYVGASYKTVSYKYPNASITPFPTFSYKLLGFSVGYLFDI